MCQPSIGTIVYNDPNTLLASQWLNSTSSYIFVDNAAIKAALFVPQDVGMQVGFDEWFGSPVDLNALGRENGTTKAQDMNILRNLALVGPNFEDEDKLIATKSANTFLGLGLEVDLLMHFSRAEDGGLQVQGYGNEKPVRVVSKSVVCNGVVYITEDVVLPSETNRQSRFPDSNPDMLASDRQLIIDAITCSDTLASLTKNLTFAAAMVSAWAKTGFVAALNDTTLSITLLLPNDNLIASYFLEKATILAAGDADLEARLITIISLYNMINGVWCPDELVQSESMKSVLGELVNATYPLKFVVGPTGGLRVVGQTSVEENWNMANVVSKADVCSSQVLYIDGAPLPLLSDKLWIQYANQVDTLIDGIKKSTLPPRGVTCNVPGWKTASDGNQSEGTDTGLIIGLVVGLTSAAVLAIVATIFIIQRVRRRRNGDLDTLGSMSSQKSSIKDDSFEFGTALSQSLQRISGSSGSRQGSFGGNNPFGKQLGGVLQTTCTWEIDSDRIAISKHEDGSEWVLGHGSLSVVYKAVLDNEKVVAVKTCPALASDLQRQGMMRATFNKEAAMLTFLSKGPQLVQFFGACQYGREKQPLLVLEYMGGGNLSDALAQDFDTRELSWNRRGKYIAIDIIKGLVFLHKNKVMHRDIKSKNILLDEQGNAKIADVGLARVRQGDTSSSSYLSDGVMGTFAWSAPELLLNQKCTEKVDIFSVGIVLWEICTGQAPRRGCMRQLRAPYDCPGKVALLINSCMSIEARKRPSAEQILAALLSMMNE